MTKTLASALVLGLLGLAGCPDIKTDTGEGVAGPTVEFDPAASIIPFPNNLVLDPTTGRVNLPQQCNESLAQTVIRTSVINTLDGFGTYESALQVTFSEAIDMATLAGHVLLFQRARGMAANDPTAAKPIPVVLIQGTTMQSSADCSTSKMVTSLTIIAQGVLEQRSTYTVALTKGIKTAAGADFGPSFTWALVGQANAPVTLDTSGNVTTNHTPLDPRDPAQLAQLQGISQLWGAHKPALDFVEKTGHVRSDILVAWEFTTQSSDALDPAVAGTPAANIATGPLLGTQSITGDCVAPNTTNCINRAVLPYSQCAATDPPTPAGNVQCFLKIALGQGVYSTGSALCAQIAPPVGCAAIKDVLGAKLSSKNYQPGAVPGAWSDPVHPAVVGPNLIDVLIFTPAAASVGTVVFGHGLGSSKKTAVAIAPQLAANGFSTVAIDFVAHDSRAVRTSTDAAKGCADVNNAPPDPTQAPQCYAPFLSSDLAGTRDNFRQTVLDLEGLVAALKACGSTNCGALTVDPAHLSYLGISLGGIIGSTTVANVPDFKSAVLNVSGVGLVDILENTPSLAIRCSLVDALISVGVVTGTPSNPPLYTMGTCTTDAWKAQPSYQQFAVINRWTLDPADGANFTAKLVTRKFLLQEVVNDEVVPNIATNNEGALVGLASAAADPANALSPPASVVIKTNPTANKFVKYVNIAPNTPGVPAGNTFQHASLLLPATTVQPGSPPPPCNPGSGVGCDGLLGTARLQADAIEFLVNNH